MCACVVESPLHAASSKRGRPSVKFCRIVQPTEHVFTSMHDRLPHRRRPKSSFVDSRQIHLVCTTWLGRIVCVGHFFASAVCIHVVPVGTGVSTRAVGCTILVDLVLLVPSFSSFMSTSSSATCYFRWHVVCVALQVFYQRWACVVSPPCCFFSVTGIGITFPLLRHVAVTASIAS